jgi:multiple sugar transport system ATP-binding protein
MSLATDPRHAGQATLGLRPEDLRFAVDGLQVRMTRSEMHGADRYVTFETLAGGAEKLVMRLGGGDVLAVDADGRATLGFNAARAHLFGADGARLRSHAAQQAAA